MVILGRNANRERLDYPELGLVDEVCLTQETRAQGTYIEGTTGTGKTSLLTYMVEQDAKYQGPMGNESVIILDPHGDWLKEVIARVPEGRLGDVKLFDPSYMLKPPGLNLLECNRDDPLERELVTGGIIDTLKKMFADMWGPRMEDLLRHSILSLLHYDGDITLVDLMLMLVNEEHRTRLTAKAIDQDPVLRSFWLDQFANYDRRQRVEVVGSSLNKIGRFLANPMIRHVVGQPESTYNIRRIMDEGEILLVNLAKGDMGEDNSSLLGKILVNQILIAALSRKDTPPAQRRPVHLYVDEYQNFATQTFPQLQSEARKYAIDTIVAHQYRDQLDLQNQGSTLNVANLVVLRVSGKDAIELSAQFELQPLEKLVERPYSQSVADGIRIRGKTAGTGSELFEEVWEMDQTYSDAQLEKANSMAQLPNYDALARVLMKKPGEKVARNLYQFRLNLIEPSEVDEATKERKLAFVRQQADKAAKFTQEEIAEYVKAQIMSVDDASDLPRSVYDPY